MGWEVGTKSLFSRGTPCPCSGAPGMKISTVNVPSTTTIAASAAVRPFFSSPVSAIVLALGMSGSLDGLRSFISRGSTIRSVTSHPPSITTTAEMALKYWLCRMVSV